jgi:hypothetical protein
MGLNKFYPSQLFIAGCPGGCQRGSGLPRDCFEIYEISKEELQRFRSK